ncbi:MAG: hypothetical protein JRN06_03900 [Nitrososphaerota archaeon]|nr:hypothetical protein [Nitrososphaerota archaeon]MDG7022886.1 hypothetical protein [Nitrososphaerota archaeon]
MPLRPAYIAGVFDSDGSFSIVRHIREGSTMGFGYIVLLQITWRDIPETVGVLEELQRMYGGSVIRGIENSGHSKHTKYARYRIDAHQGVSLRTFSPASGSRGDRPKSVCRRL